MASSGTVTPAAGATLDRPLVGNEIRLLRFGRQQPNSHHSFVPSESSTATCPVRDAHLECTTGYHRLGQAPAYIALSYCWGDAQLTRPLVVDGRIRDVGANAKEALLHLRKEPGDIYVWIDQLCINQDDPAEKASQVRLMWQIYSSADRVVAWLGPAADDSDFLVDHLICTAALLRAGEHEEVIRLHSDGPLLRRASLAFRAFCQRAYWRRLWIIQEFSSAQRLAIAAGSSRLGYEELRDALLYLNNRPGQLASPDGAAEEQAPGYMKTRVEMMRAFKSSAASFMDGVLSRRRRYQLRQMMMGQQSLPPAGSPPLSSWEEDVVKQRETLLRVLITTLVLEYDYNQPEASNPRDRIFSVLHFADDKSEFPEFPDYERECEDIYEEAARRMLAQGHIDVLCYCQSSEGVGEKTTLATWAPDWRMPIKRPCVNIWQAKFCASGDTLSDQVVTVPDPRTVTLRGFAVDRVKHVGSLWNPDWLAKLDCGAALSYLAEVKELCAASPRYRQSPPAEGHDAGGGAAVDLELEAMRIASADRYNYREPERQPELREGYRAAVEYMEAIVAGEDPYAGFELQVDDEIGWHAPWYTFCLKNLHSRRPFVSDTGYVGLAPGLALPGDQVVIFLGGRAAYVVREAAEVGAWQLVGECYTHGVMYGELLMGEPEVRTFVLR